MSGFQPQAEFPVRSLPSFDHESRVEEDDHGALRLWLRLLTCGNMIEARIRAHLRTEFNCTLPRFDLLAQLDRHGEGLKMGELSQRLMVTGGNITGITDQLEADGWVARAGVDSDRRAWRVKLTPRGKKAFRQMAAVHERWVVALFTELDAKEASRLYALLGDLKASILARDRTRAKPS